MLILEGFTEISDGGFARILHHHPREATSYSSQDKKVSNKVNSVVNFQHVRKISEFDNGQMVGN